MDWRTLWGIWGRAILRWSRANHGNTPSLSPRQWGVLAQAQVGQMGPAGATGPAGSQGAMGLQGSQGLAGPAGVAGEVGPTGVPGLTYQGTYTPGSNYKVGDVVLWNGTSYASLIAGNHGNTPDSSAPQWGVLSLQGPAGTTGTQGGPGVAGPQGSPGSVGPPGERGGQGLQGIAGQAGAQGIPGAAGAEGLQGPMGLGGPAGPTGLSFRGAYVSGTNYGMGDGVMYGGAGYVSLAGGNRGNTPDGSPQQWAMFAAAGLNGANGAVGPIGAQGVAGSQGSLGPMGPVGPVGGTGPQGPAVANYTGTYTSGDELWIERCGELWRVDVHFDGGGESWEYAGWELRDVGDSGGAWANWCCWSTGGCWRCGAFGSDGSCGCYRAAGAACQLQRRVECGASLCGGRRGQLWGVELCGGCGEQREAA